MKLLLEGLLCYLVLLVATTLKTESILFARWVRFKEKPKAVRKKEYVKNLIFCAIVTVMFISYLFVKMHIK
jgi:hypothetical protein